MNRYKISEEDGINLFLQQDKPHIEEEQPGGHAPDKRFRMSGKKLIVLGASLLIFILALVLSIIYVKNVRDENLMVNKLTDEYDDYMKWASKDFTTMHEVVDSLLTKTDNLIENFRVAVDMYPSQQSLKKIYGELLVRKHVINLQVEYLTYGDITYTKLSDVDYRLISNNNPDMLFAVDLLREIIPFDRFENDYPLPPEAANVAPESWKIDSLFTHGSTIKNLLNANDIALKEKLPGLYKMIQYIFNNIYPRAFAWKNFWDKYSLYTKSTNNEEKADLLQDLQAQFPKLTLIGNNSLEGIAGVNNVVIGISSTAVLPDGITSMEDEWQPVLNFLEKNCGIKFSLQVYKSEDDLFVAYSNGTVSFALFNNVMSDRLYSARIGSPVLIRTWNKKPYVDIVAVSGGRGYKDINSLKGAKAAFSKNAYLAPFVSFYKSGIEPEKHFSRLSYANNSYSAIDSVVSGRCDVAFVTEEVAYYYKNANPGIRLFENFSLGSEPLTLMWCKDNVSLDVVSNVQSLLRTGDPTIIYSTNSYSLHPYGDWTAIDDLRLKNMFQGFSSESIAKVNKIFLMPVKTYGNIDQAKLKEEITSGLSMRGYDVVDVESLGLTQDILNRIQKVALYCQVSRKQGTNDYTFTCLREKPGSKQDLFSLNMHEAGYPPNLLRLIYNVTVHVPLYMTIVKIENNTVQLRLPANIVAEPGKEVNFARIKAGNAKISILGDQEMEIIGKGRIESDSGNLIYVKISDQLKNKLLPGDYAELVF